MEKKIKLTIIVSKTQYGQRLDQALTRLLPYSRSHIKKWILNQHVLVNGKIWNQPKKKVLGREIININTNFLEESYFKPQNIPLNILYEDSDIIIVIKPCNLVVHPGAGISQGTMLNALLHHYPSLSDIPRAGIVHRLDKDTSGLMVIAKTISSQKYLTESLKLHKVIREYEAIATGYMIEDGIIDQPIKRHPIKRTHMSIHPMGKHAVTHYRIIEHFRMYTFLRLRLETGRTHQIRVHMAYLSHPLVGDQLYNNHPKFPKEASEAYISALYNFNRQALHASMLRLYHPTSGIEMEWNAPMPQDMAHLIEMMRIDFKEKTI